MSEGSNILARTFVEHLPPEQVALVERLSSLDKVLRECVSQARQSWPTLHLDPVIYLAHLACHLPPDSAPEAGLRRMRTSDLYLACACMQGDQVAVALFEHHFLPDVRAALAKVDIQASQADEMQQVIRTLLLVPRGDREPRLAQYAGSADLRRWLWVTTTRRALNFKKQHRRETALEDDALLELTDPHDQELTFLKRKYQHDFKVVFHETLATLSSRERTLLRLHLLDGLSIDQLGSMFDVHRATAARWLERIRNKLHSGTRAALMQRLQVSPAEYQSIMKIIMSRFDASIRRVLDDPSLLP